MAESKKGKAQELYPSQIRLVEGFNARYDMGDMKGFMASIKESGIKVPVSVIKTKDKTEDNLPIYELVDGHRRVTAATKISEKQEDWVMIPFVDVTGLSEEEKITLMLVTGANQQPLNMLERAYGIQRLKEENEELSDVAIGKRLGVSSQHVADCLLLLTAGKDTIKQIKSGAVSPSAAVEFLKNADSEVVDKAVDKAVAKAETEGKNKVSKKQVEEAAGAPLTKKSSAAARSTKEGAPEAPAGKPEVVKKADESINKLVFLEQQLNEAGELEDDATANPVAFAALSGLILFLKGRVQVVELMSIFYGDGTDLPELAGGKAASDEVSQKGKAAKKPAKKAPAEEVDEDSDEAIFDADADQGPAGKKAAPKKKAAPVAEDDLDEEDADEEEAPAKPAKKPENLMEKMRRLEEVPAKKDAKKVPAKAAAPVKAAKKAPVAEEDDEDLDFNDDEEDDLDEIPAPAKKGKKAPVPEDDEDDEFE